MTIDLYLLAGFLGSGKTTTLRHILDRMPDPRGTLVVINEAGAIGLDGRLVERHGLTVKELSNGCICCSLAIGLIELFQILIKSDDPPARIIMEASGLANPAKLRQTVNKFKDSLGVVKTIVLLDPEIWEVREGLGSFFSLQLAAADLVLLNKTDLLTGERVAALLEEIRAELPGVNLAPVSRGQVALELFWAAPPAFSGERPFLGDELVMSGFEVFTYQSEQSFDETMFESFIEASGPGYARIKGQVLLTTGPAYFDYVRGHWEWQAPPPGLSGTILVFIGRKVNPETLTAQLENAAR